MDTNNEHIICRVARDELTIDGQVFWRGDTVELPAAFAVSLEHEGDVERADS